MLNKASVESVLQASLDAIETTHLRNNSSKVVLCLKMSLGHFRKDFKLLTSKQATFIWECLVNIRKDTMKIWNAKDEVAKENAQITYETFIVGSMLFPKEQTMTKLCHCSGSRCTQYQQNHGSFVPSNRVFGFCYSRDLTRVGRVSPL